MVLIEGCKLSGVRGNATRACPGQTINQSIFSATSSIIIVLSRGCQCDVLQSVSELPGHSTTSTPA